MRRREHAHVHPDRRLRADRHDLVLLQGAEQPRLQAGRDVADLVEEQRAAVGLAEEAGTRGAGAREGPPHVAEQLALEQPFGERGAVDRHEPPVGALGEVVDGAGHQLLARAGLARAPARSPATARRAPASSSPR